MNLAIRPVDANNVHQLWPVVRVFIDEALASGDGFPEWAACYNADHILQYLVSNAWLLIVAVDEENVIHGACTVSFINYPLYRVAFITTIGGKLISSKNTFEQLKQVLRAYGATKIQGSGKESIVRLWKRFKFEPRNTLVEVLI
jgi:hypothetical protein